MSAMLRVYLGWLHVVICKFILWCIREDFPGGETSEPGSEGRIEDIQEEGQGLKYQRQRECLGQRPEKKKRYNMFVKL